MPVAVAVPPFEHARLLASAWADGPPRHDLGGSGFSAPPWAERGLPAPAWDAAGLDLHPGTALRDRLARRAGLPSEGTLVTAGTTAANLAVIAALAAPGRNVVCERPGYAPLAHVAQAFGAEVRFVDRDPDGWRLDPDAVAAACDGATVLVALTSPNNPTGVADRPADLVALAEAAADHDAHVLVDQVFRELTDHPVAATLHPALITTAGVNKCWGAPGIRIGWLHAPPDRMPDIVNAHQTLVLAPSRSGMAAVDVLLDHGSACRAALEARLRATHAPYRAWCQEAGVAAGPGRGLTDFPAVPGEDTAELARRALEDGLLLIPGEAFGRPGHVRIGLGGDPDRLRRALDALRPRLAAKAM